MLTRNTTLYFAVSGGLLGVGLALFGTMMAVTFFVAILLHEAGHWLFYRLAGLRAYVFASPFFGLTWLCEEAPISALTPCLWQDPEEELVPPLSAFGEGFMLLSGTLLSLVLGGLLFTLTMPAEPLLPALCLAFLQELIIVMMIVNILNLCLLVPITDGGRTVLLIFSTSHEYRMWILAAALLAQGAIIAFMLGPLFGAVLTVCAAAALPLLVTHYSESSWELSFGQRMLLFASWAGILVSSTVLISRLVCPMDILAAFMESE